MKNSFTMALALVASANAMTLQTDDYASACKQIYDTAPAFTRSADGGEDDGEIVNEQEDDCCTFFVGRDYTDRALQCCHNGGSTEIALAGTNWDDRFTSFQCGAAVKYELWRNHIDQVHSKTVVTTGAGPINNSVLARYNDLITNIVLEPYDDVEAPAVTAFREQGCVGRSARLDFGGAGSNTGPLEDTVASNYFVRLEFDELGGIDIDRVNSFAIPYGHSIHITVYECEDKMVHEETDCRLSYPYGYNGYVDGNVCVNVDWSKFEAPWVYIKGVELKKVVFL